MKRALVCLLSLALLLLGAPARAALVDAFYCVDLAVDFEDGSTGDLLDNAIVRPRGALLRFVHPGGQSGYYLDWDGSTPGCRWIEIEDSRTYEVKLVTQARVNDNYIYVEYNGNIAEQTLLTGHQPVDGYMYSLDADWSYANNVLAATTWALARRSGGITGQDFNFAIHSYAADPGGPAYYSQSLQEVRLHWNSTYWKYTIVHEFGHMLSDAANGWLGLDFSYSATKDGCNQDGGTYPYDRYSHYINSKEYQSAAAVEGIANFYAAVAFNTDQEFDDCEFEVAGNIDWNSDGDWDGVNFEPSVFSCEVGLTEPSPDVDNFDYLGDFCLAGSVEWKNRGTEYDWLRMFWDLTTDQAVGVDEIFSIWDWADPHDWNMTGDAQGNNYPAGRMHDAAQDVGGNSLQSTYDTCAANNGVDR